MRKNGKRVLASPPLTESEFANLFFLRRAIAAILVFFIFSHFLMSFYVPTGSMLPTLNIGETVLATRIYEDTDINRADIVAFRPFTPENNYLGASESERNIIYVKRVMGLPGDTVEIRNGILYINDEPQDEDYLPEGIVMNNFQRVTVPDNCYFMLGDNRNHSDDSRVIGFIPRENLLSKSIFHINSLVGRWLLSK